MSTFFEIMGIADKPYTPKALKLVHIPEPDKIYPTARAALNSIMLGMGLSKDDDVLFPCVYCTMSREWVFNRFIYDATFAPRDYLDFRRIKDDGMYSPWFYSIDCEEGGHAFIYELDSGGFTVCYESQDTQSSEKLDNHNAYATDRPSMYSAILYHENPYTLLRFS